MWLSKGLCWKITKIRTYAQFYTQNRYSGLQNGVFDFTVLTYDLTALGFLVITSCTEVSTTGWPKSWNLWKILHSHAVGSYCAHFHWHEFFICYTRYEVSLPCPGYSRLRTPHTLHTDTQYFSLQMRSISVEEDLKGRVWENVGTWNFLVVVVEHVFVGQSPDARCAVLARRHNDGAVVVEGAGEDVVAVAVEELDTGARLHRPHARRVVRWRGQKLEAPGAEASLGHLQLVPLHHGHNLQCPDVPHSRCSVLATRA